MRKGYSWTDDIKRMTDLPKTEEVDVQREQIRGLYIVGLLAVLVAFKLSSKLDPSADTFFTLVIFFWGTYSFLMIFGYSGLKNPIFDVSKKTNEAFSAFVRECGQLVLVMSLGASIVFFVLYFWYALVLVGIVLVIVVPIYYTIKVLRRRLRKKDKEPS